MSDRDHREGPSHAIAHHRVSHRASLRVGEELFTTRFARGCATSACAGTCCRDGAIVDLALRDRIVREAPLIQRHMDASQEHDPARWFDPEPYDDADYPSGRGISTEVVNGACVFLDTRRRCSLQLAEPESPDLKPFFCRAYPITILDGCVSLDVDWCPGATACCAPVSDGEQSALEVCADELRHVLGDAGLGELHAIAESRLAERALADMETSRSRERA